QAPLNHVVPPATPSTTPPTHAPNSAFEISFARQNPNDPAMINMARGNELNTSNAQVRSFSPEASAEFPEPAIEYARPAPTAVYRSNSPPTAALEAVAAAPHPSCPASASTDLSAAANHIRLRAERPEHTAAIRIRVRSPV